MLEFVADWLAPVWFIGMLWLIGGSSRKRKSVTVFRSKTRW